MSAYGFNPEVCLQVLHGIAEEISSGVSDSTYLLRCVRNSIASRMKELIDFLWRKYQVPQKLKHLEELEKRAEVTDAWRPTTGEANLNPIIASCLLKRKMELKKQIELVRKESAKITPYLKQIPELCKQQLEEIESINRNMSETLRLRTEMQVKMQENLT